jgi:TubC N-terminal docking domain
MTLTELLDELNARGVVLKVNGDRLIAHAHKGSLTPELQADLKQHKAALIALLSLQAPEQLDLVIPQFDTEIALLDLYDRWCKATDPNDPKWRQAYAEAAIAARLPCYDEHGVMDLGSGGWRRWAIDG